VAFDGLLFQLVEVPECVVCGMDSVTTLILFDTELGAVGPNTLLGLKLGSLATVHR